jgi:hypothetical protein
MMTSMIDQLNEEIKYAKLRQDDIFPITEEYTLLDEIRGIYIKWKAREEAILKIIENKKIEWNNKEWVSNQELDLINGYVEDVIEELKKSISEAKG